jgi:hypothetical protein
VATRKSITIQRSLQPSKIRVRSGSCREGHEQLPGLLLLQNEPPQRLLIHRLITHTCPYKLQASDKFLLPQDLVDSRVTLSSRSHETGKGNVGSFAQVDGAVLVDLRGMNSTSAMESWMEEWSLDVMIWSV